MLPLMLGRGSWRAAISDFLTLALSLAVVGSLATLSVLTLLIFSGGYSLLEGARGRRKKRYNGEF
jgi:hypothetical protein